MKKLILGIGTLSILFLATGCMEKSDKDPDVQKLVKSLEDGKANSTEKDVKELMRGVEAIEHGDDEGKVSKTDKEVEDLKPFMDVYGGDE